MSNLKNVKLEELRKMASQMKIEGRSKMNKEELLKVVKKNIKKGGVVPDELSIITKGRREVLFPYENRGSIGYDPNEEREIIKNLGRIIGLEKVGNLFKIFSEKNRKIYLVKLKKGHGLDTNIHNNHLYITDNIEVTGIPSSNETGFVFYQIIKKPSMLRSLGSRMGIRAPLVHNLTTNEYTYKNNQGRNQRSRIVRNIPEDILNDLFRPIFNPPVHHPAPIYQPPVPAPGFNLSRHSTFLASNSNEVQQNNRNGNECPICIDKLSAKHPKNPNGSNNMSTTYTGVVKLRCGHKLHKECIEEWVRHGRRDCPLCRARINQ